MIDESTRTLTPAQLAADLQVSKRTLSRWVKQGVCPRPLWLAPGTIRFRQSDITRWLAAEAESASAGSPETAAARVVSGDEPDLI
jgi:predicted DNA-binding transcriptional regulator AlpA